MGIREENLNLTLKGAAPNDTMKAIIGYKNFELSNHLGNVLVVVNEKKVSDNGSDASSNGLVDYYTSKNTSVTDYGIWGDALPQRNANSTDYLRGFNGMEKDEEIKGENNSLDFGERIYDPRTGRFLSIDGLTVEYPWYTPYQFAGNKPIWAIDLDGLEEAFATDKFDPKSRQNIRYFKLNPSATLKDKGKIQYTYIDKTTEIKDGSTSDLEQVKELLESKGRTVEIGVTLPIKKESAEDIGNKTPSPEKPKLGSNNPIVSNKPTTPNLDPSPTPPVKPKPTIEPGVKNVDLTFKPDLTTFESDNSIKELVKIVKDLESNPDFKGILEIGTKYEAGEKATKLLEERKARLEELIIIISPNFDKERLEIKTKTDSNRGATIKFEKK